MSAAPRGAPGTSGPGGAGGWLRAEGPWLVVSLLAVVAAQLLAHEAPGFPFGSDWGQYLQGADALWRQENSAPYPSWRGPLYMFLLGGPGQIWGYVAAGRIVSRVAAAIAVISAALAGRALAGRQVAAASALLAAGFVPLQQAAVWVNPYALMAATWGLALAAGLATARWGRPWIAALAGLATGAAVATDPRGWLLVPLVLGLGLLGTARRCWRSLAALGTGLLLTLAVTLFVQRDLPNTPLLQAIHAQHTLSSELVGMKTGAEHPLAACLQQDAQSGRMATTTSCARHLLAFNLGRMAPRGFVPPAWPLLFLPLGLLPARWGRRASLAATAAVLLPILALVAGLAWVEWAPRYSASYAIPLALLGPVVAARLLLQREARRLRALFWPAVIAWALLAIPGAHPRDEGDRDLPGERQLLDFAAWLEGQARPGDLVLNCSQQPVQMLLLPRPTLAEYRDAGRHEQCRGWANAPPTAAGRRLFLTVHDPYSGACMGECAGLDPSELGWREHALPDSAPPGVRGWTK